MSDLRRHIAWSGRCKACKLLKQDLELFDEMHQRLLIKKQPVAIVVKWLNERIEAKNLSRKEKLKPFNDNNVHTHLKKHITDEGQLLREVAIPPPAITDSTLNKVEEDTANMVLNPPVKKEEIDIFEVGEDTSRVLLQSLIWYKEDIEKNLKEGKKPNAAYVKSVHELLEAILQTQKSISQTRNSARVAGEAVSRMAQVVTDAYLAKLTEVTKEAKQLMSANIGGSLPDEVVNLIKNRMGSAMKSIMMESYAAVIQEFKIK